MRRSIKSRVDPRLTTTPHGMAPSPRALQFARFDKVMILSRFLTMRPPIATVFCRNWTVMVFEHPGILRPAFLPSVVSRESSVVTDPILLGLLIVQHALHMTLDVIRPHRCAHSRKHAFLAPPAANSLVSLFSAIVPWIGKDRIVKYHDLWSARSTSQRR